MSGLPNSPGIARRIAAWWSNWNDGRRAARELRGCDRTDLERMARDVGMVGRDLTSLAAQGGQSGALLHRRLGALEIDAAALADREPAVMRDLERTCTCCDSKTVCERDFEQAEASRNWRGYCPNAPTLDAISEEKDLKTHAGSKNE